MDMSKYQELFFSESREHLHSMNTLLLAMENDSFDAEKTAKMFRGAHSIKGMATTMNFPRTAALAHSLEDCLSTLQKKQKLLPTVVEVLLEGFELLANLVADLEAKKEERDIDFFLAKLSDPGLGEIVSAGSSSDNRSEKTSNSGKNIALHIHLKQPVFCTETLTAAISRRLGAAGELMATDFSSEAGRQMVKIQLRTSCSADILRKVLGKIEGVEKVVFPFALSAQTSPAKSSAEFLKSVRISTDVLDYLNNITGELITTRHRLEAAFGRCSDAGLGESLAELACQIADLQHHVRKIRMMPLEHITASLPRFVRDLSREIGKIIYLEMTGENVELDRAVLEALADPLLHLIRNAADHGIEKTGTIAISAMREQDLVLLKIQDNGKGIDVEVLRKKIAHMKLLPETQIPGLKDSDVLQMICHPGFSTSDRITNISGRGVGMNIVKSAVNQLGGSLEIRSQKGLGTEMILKIPLHVAIIHVLLVAAGMHTVGIPITQVISILENDSLDLCDLQTHPSVELIRRQGEDGEEETEAVPVVFLAELLALEKQPKAENAPMILVECGGRKIAVAVDKLIGKKEVFVKSLDFPLSGIKGLSGATILGNGKVFFILDIQSLLQVEQFQCVAVG